MPGATALGLVALVMGGTDRLITAPCAPPGTSLWQTLSKPVLWQWQGFVDGFLETQKRRLEA